MAVFEFRELRPASALVPAIPPLRVGPWERAPQTIPAFEAGPGPGRPCGAPDSLWRVLLARDDDAHRAALAQGERSVAHTHAILDDLPRRFDRALDQARAALDPAHARATPPLLAAPAQRSRSTPATPLPRRALSPDAELRAALDPAHVHAGPPSFAAPAQPPRSTPATPLPRPRPSPESELLAALTRPALPRADELTAWSATGPGAPSAAHDPGWLEQTFERIADLARGRARIETHLAGALVAHSLMTLSGDTELWTAPRLSPAGARLHARTVAVAVRTRHAWARILTLVVRGCGQLLVFGLPGGAAAIIPLVWRFVRGVLHEVRDLQAALPPAD